jgi:diguanylate cyclase (GGDEF)-like protein
LREAILNLERMAYVDALTNIANRRQFDETLEREWRRAMREQTPLSLVLLDIDRFKLFNDYYGHPAGDDCLRRVAMAIGSAARRPSDLVARYGGEEFALILPVTDATGAEMVAQDARASIAALGLAHEGNTACGGVVTGSFGVATAFPQFCASPAARLDLIAEADGFLYESKRTGRNRIVSLDIITRGGAVPLLANEATRLAALEAYDAAGATRRTVEMDQIAQLAATLTTAPIGLVSFVGRDEQRFGGIFGLDGVGSTKRDVSFCAHTILGDEPFVVPDATRDVRFAANPLVAGEMGVRYYAGAPIISKTTGHRLGSVCIIDTSARTETTSAERALLTDLAKMAANLLEDNMQTAASVTSS